MGLEKNTPSAIAVQAVGEGAKLNPGALLVGFWMLQNPLFSVIHHGFLLVSQIFIDRRRQNGNNPDTLTLVERLLHSLSAAARYLNATLPCRHMPDSQSYPRQSRRYLRGSGAVKANHELDGGESLIW